MTARTPERATYTIVLRPEPGVTDPERVLRLALKALLRNHQMRCIAIAQTPPPATKAATSRRASA